mmetsp:Transcript_125563/g.287682  ORF Transcript_125563/g.287682 Transcript_125563/m.287682 type:complete len:130 (+) Transcript_125563:742-1131(+)
MARSGYGTFEIWQSMLPASIGRATVISVWHLECPAACWVLGAVMGRYFFFSRQTGALLSSKCVSSDPIVSVDFHPEGRLICTSAGTRVFPNYDRDSPPRDLEDIPLPLEKRPKVENGCAQVWSFDVAES